MRDIQVLQVTVPSQTLHFRKGEVSPLTSDQLLAPVSISNPPNFIAGISRLVTASNCSSINSYHTSSAVYLHKINDATFAYDFRMRYEPVCMMRPGWIIEFRDTEPDLEGKRIRGRSNFLKILTPDNRVDYYTHLRNSWWTEVGQAEFNFVHRKQQTLALKN